MAPLAPLRLCFIRAAFLRLGAEYLLGLLVEAELEHEIPYIFALEQDQIDFWIKLGHAALFVILFGGQAGTQCGQLDVQILVGQIKIRGERHGDIAILVPLQGKRSTLVFPVNVVKIEDFRKFFFRRMSKWRVMLRFQ